MRKVFIGGLTSTAAVVAIWIAFGTGNGGGTAICHSVSQYGITWSFARGVPCGQFANSDWWVAPRPGDATVRITSITPTFNGTRNGAEVNPTSDPDPNHDTQGYDDRLDHFNASDAASTPLDAAPGDSIIKTVSTADDPCGLGASGIHLHQPCLDTAAVLSVLSASADHTGDFRPPYAGSLKPVFHVSQLQTNLLPSLAPVSGTPSLSSLARRYQRVQIDDSSSFAGRYMHASLNYSTKNSMSEFDTTSGNRIEAQTGAYGAQLAGDSDEAALRLELNDSVSAKTPLLVNFVQAGIDYYGLKNAGVSWSGAFGSGGGHDEGRAIAVAFAAVLLNDTAMKADLSGDGVDPDGLTTGRYGTENSDTYYSTASGAGGVVLWGRVGPDCTAEVYNDVLGSDPRSGGTAGPVDCRDPDEYIDGGLNADLTGRGNYQQCCTSGPFKGAALAALLLPGAKSAWNHDAFFDYADRWVTTGFHTRPDDRTPDRYPALDGTLADNAGFESTFANNMWTAYRSTVP